MYDALTINRFDCFLKFIVRPLNIKIYDNFNFVFLCYFLSRMFEISLPHDVTFLHGKNDFTQVSKNLARYTPKNNFVGPSK